MVKRKQPVRGLEGVVAADTWLSHVDGHNGKLYYRGYDIDQLAGRVCYEEVVHLLWFGHLPTRKELDDFRAELVGNMLLPPQVVEILRLSPPKANPMVVLRVALSSLGLFDPDGGHNSEPANLRKAKRIQAQMAAIIAAMWRIRQGLPLLGSDGKSDYATSFLYMFNGKMPSRTEARAMDTLLMLHADHGLAASTFAARATVSTLAGMHSALTASLASLKGPLHGGANTKVMDMLEEIDNPRRVKAYIEAMLAKGKRIMGFGHRVYQTQDPRSRHLRKMSQKLCQGSAERACYMDIQKRIEEIVTRKKGIYPNVDFYSGTVQLALGIPKEYFTCIFALARTAGWIAHVFEQSADNRLIRPSANYIGGFDHKFVPLDKR